MKIDTLAFYNHANRGDLHVSRELVRLFCERIKVRDCFYAHRHSSRILADMPLRQTPLPPEFKQEHPFYLDKARGLLALNTWYAVSPTFAEKRCSLNTLRDLFDMHARMHGIAGELPYIPELIPREYRIWPYREWSRQFLAHVTCGKPLVLVSNGPTLSGQTSGDLNVFNAAMARVVEEHPEHTFFFTDPAGVPQAPNAVLTKDFTDVANEDCDLPECSAISTFCRVIIGRGSGPYSFSYVQENLLNEAKTFVCFTDDERTARWVYPLGVVKANIVWSNRYNQDDIYSVVSGAL